jgi:BirA family transcriptional regulator, biotin operon repressor / biotin---[acetyl-CoA-carboxylase] ligase
VDLPSACQIRTELARDLPGWSVVYFDRLGSTQDEARRLAEGGARHGTVVIADYQSAGRGRRGRRWMAPPGTSLLLSLILRPRLRPDRVMWLTAVGSLAVLDAIESQTRLKACLKWPNDILLDRAKAGGILSEAEFDGERLLYALLGIGLNVNLEPVDLPTGLPMPATSLSHVSGQAVPRLPLLVALARAVEARCQALVEGASPVGEWASRLSTLGQQVTVSTQEGSYDGMAEGVDEWGALLVRPQDGRLTRVWAADVALHPRCAPREAD